MRKQSKQTKPKKQRKKRSSPPKRSHSGRPDVLLNVDEGGIWTLARVQKVVDNAVAQGAECGFISLNSRNLAHLKAVMTPDFEFKLPVTIGWSGEP